jgi:type IV secretion system protein VirB10
MSDTHIEAENPSIRPSAPVERSISPISGPLGAGRAGKAIVVAALIAGCGVFLVATWRGPKPHAAMAPDQPARQVVPFEPLVTSPAPTLANPGAGAPELGPTGLPARQPGASAGPPANAAAPAAMSQAEIRGAPLIAYSRESAPTGVASSPNGPTVPAIEVAGSASTELDQLRRGSVIGEVRATRLPDRNFLIVAGGVIPCLLQTAMDTATPGYASCLIPRDVFSDNGAVVLLEKGTRVLGEYRSSLKQGQTRLFVLWTRAVTPAGVAIRLESPAADALGRAGFDGSLDTHFWERFGGALLLSIVDDSSSGLASGSTSNTARVPSDAAAVALQNSVNIPPSLRKAQGAEVSIFVAQDFDFSGVYSLKAR